MTQRWRKKLGDLDKAGPSDDVFTRAKEGPMHRDEAVVGPKMTTRVGTVVVAFAVFALAISVFAIPALRMGGGQAAAGGGLFPVWPAQSSDELQQLQADTNAGNTAWALNPKSVVEQFGQKVMGWSDAVVSEATVIGCTANFVSASWVYPTGVVMSGSPSSAGVSCVSVGYPPTASGYEGAGTTAGVMTGPSPDASGASIGGFRQYLISERGLVLGDGTVIPPPEVVVVYQPLKQGDGQIWAVLEARSPNIELPVGAGQTVHDGASISAGFNTNLEPDARLHILRPTCRFLDLPLSGGRGKGHRDDGVVCGLGVLFRSASRLRVGRGLVAIVGWPRRIGARRSARRPAPTGARRVSPRSQS